MHRRLRLARRATTLSVLVTACTSGNLERPSNPASAPPPTPESEYLFKANDGTTTPAFRGVVKVPENRANPSGRTIELHYVRFPATTPQAGPPIIYLAGGPGGSGVATARGRRFPLFMAMRAFGDVIALDQRGTGWSAAAPDCPVDPAPLDKPASVKDITAAARAELEKCRAFWTKEGFDVAGYTTVESARDLDALRTHLRAEKVTLWGISYGTHLALAAVKVLGPRIDRLVLASAEGLDQTVKLPSRTDAYFQRLQAAIDEQPAAKAMLPDAAGLMRAVHAQLERAPVMIPLPGQAGRVLLTKTLMQQMASGSISDPRGAARMLLLYGAVAGRQYAPVAQVLARYLPYLSPNKLPLMPAAMDVASGIGAERLQRVEREAKTAVLGDLLNYPMPHLAGALDLDLGDGFRTPPTSDVPTLLLSGTLDGRTYPESQQEAVRKLSNVTTVTVTNAGHNLFMVSPEVTATIERFMRGELKGDTTIEVAPPAFMPKGGPPR